MAQKNFKVNNGVTTPLTTFEYNDGNVANTRQVTIQPSSATVANYSLQLPPTSGALIPAVLGDVTLDSGTVIDIAVTSGGSGYTAAPSVIISGDGAFAIATAILTNGSVSSITIDSGGEGYTTATASLASSGGRYLTLDNNGGNLSWQQISTIDLQTVNSAVLFGNGGVIEGNLGFTFSPDMLLAKLGCTAPGGQSARFGYSNIIHQIDNAFFTKIAGDSGLTFGGAEDYLGTNAHTITFQTPAPLTGEWSGYTLTLPRYLPNTNGSFLSGNTDGTMSWNIISNIANGNSNVTIPTANGNVIINSSGNTILTITDTGANITGTANVTGNTNLGGNTNITGNANISGGVLNLSNGTTNWINYGANGYGVPTFTTRSIGTKIVLFSQVNSSNVDYALGISSGNLWNSIPQNTSGYGYQWYAGETQIMSLIGTGTLNVVGNVNANAGLTSNGNITVVNADLGNLATANYFKGVLLNGNSNVSVALNGNVNFSAVGNSNVVQVTGTGLVVNGVANVTGNLTSANSNTGNSTITGTATLSGNVNATGANVSLGAVGNLHITGGTSGQILSTNGSGGLSWANLTVTTVANGNSNVTVAANANVTISSNGQANIFNIASNSTHATTTITDDVTITGNLLVQGTSSNVNVNNLSIADPIIDLGVNGNGGPLIATDGRDRGMSAHLYGANLVTTTSAITASGNAILTLTSLTGAAVGQPVYANLANSAAVFANTAVVSNVDVANSQITVSTNALYAVPSGISVVLGKDIQEFFGWKTTGSNSSQFIFTQNASITNGIVTVGQYANAQANWYIGNINATQIGVDATTTTNVVGKTNFYANTVTIGANSGLTLTGNVFANAANVTLGSVSNLKILGGSNNQFLSTDGTGNLQWATFGAVPAIHFNVSSNGNNQQFSNTNIGSYNNSNASTAVFRNGLLIENTDYSLLNNTITINVQLFNGDTIDIAPTFVANVASAGGGGGATSNISNGISNVNIATSGGNVTTSVGGSANIFVVDATNVTASGNVIATVGVKTPLVFNGNSNISITSNGNIAFTSNANTAMTVATDGQVYIGNLKIAANAVSATATNGDVGLTPNGAGFINLNANAKVTGNINSTANATYNLGNSSLYWNNVYATTLLLSGSNIVSNTNGLFYNANFLLANGTSKDFTSTGNITANVYTGNGSGLTALTGANVTGYVNNAANANIANVANYVATTGATAVNATWYIPVTNTNASGNIALNTVTAFTLVPSTGLLTTPLASFTSTTDTTVSTDGAVTVAGGLGIAKSLNVGGNAKVTGTANIVGNANVGNLGTSTAIITTGNITTVNTGLVQNGNSNIAITSNANITLTAKSNATMTITDTGANITGTGNFSGNLSAANLIGPLANGNSNVNIATANGNVTITAVGNTTLTVSGTGANITGTANISGNANVANLGTAGIYGATNSNSNVIFTNTNIFFGANGVANGIQFGATGGGAATATLTAAGGATLTLTNTGTGVSQTASAGGGISVSGGGNLPLAAGTSNVRIFANANIAFSSAGNANILVVTGTSTNTTGSANITYEPATAVGAAITTTGKDTQGGTGWFDFLKATNTTSGATNPSKSFRLNSTGALEIINNAYNATLLSLTDTGNLSIAGTYSVAGKLAVNGPAFSAYANATGQTITSGSQQKVLFQTEEFDTNNNYASSRFTPTVEGYYQLNAEVRLDGATGTGEFMIVLYKNGAEYKRGTNQSGTQIAANFWAMTVNSLVYANGSTDYFEIYVQQTSGGSVTVTAVNNPAITWFNGCMVRGA